MDQVCVQGKGDISQCVKQIKDALHEKTNQICYQQNNILWCLCLKQAENNLPVD